LATRKPIGEKDQGVFILLSKFPSEAQMCVGNDGGHDY